MRILGGVRRSAATWIVLVIAASGLIAVGSAAPASAAEGIACSARIDRFGDGRLPPRPPGTDQVTAASLSINIPQSPFPMNGSRFLVMQTDVFRGDIAELSQNSPQGTYLFSTEGGSTGPASQPDQTYAAPALRAAFSPYSSYSSVWFQVRLPSGEPQDLNGYWRLDLTFSDCDTDNDGALDRAVDNCDGLSNPDQRDFDRDGAGDACDADDDGDGAADPTDNCAMLANDQTDSDGDAIGNACDSTPFPPAPPSGTTTGSTTTGPVPGSTTGPVAAARTLTLKYAQRKRVFRGVVASAVGSCSAYAEASLWRKKRGADRRLVISTTDDAGKFRTPTVRRPGKYYVTIEANADGSCAGARSPLVRIRRR